MVLSMVTGNRRRHEEFHLRLLPLEGIHFRSMASLPLDRSFRVRRAMVVAANGAQISTSPILSDIVMFERLVDGRIIYTNDSALSIPVYLA